MQCVSAGAHFIIMGEWILNFGEFFGECIKKSDISMNRLATLIGMNRGNLYSVVNGSRQIKSEDFMNAVRLLSLAKNDADRLSDLYFSEYYGAEQFNKIKFVIRELSRFQAFQAPKDLSVEAFAGKTNLWNELQLLAALDHLIKNSESEIITNYPFESKQIDELFYANVYNKTITGFIHIVSMKDSLSTLFSCLRFLFLQSFPYYTYEPLYSDCSVYPYFAVGDNGAVLFDNEKGLFVCDWEAVAQIREKAQSFLEKCTQLGQLPGNIFEIKDYYAGINSFRTASVFHRYPCITVYFYLEMFYAIARPDLENREAMVHMAYEHYRSARANVDFSSFISLDGLNRFVETGNVAEIPKSMKVPLPKEEIIRCLENIRTAVENGKMYIWDSNKISMTEGLILENMSGNDIFVCGCRYDSSDFFEPDVFMAMLNDPSLNKVIADVGDYMIRAELVMNKKTVLACIDTHIASLRNRE